MKDRQFSDRLERSRTGFVDCVCIVIYWVGSGYCYMAGSELRVLSVGEEQEQ